MEGFLTLQKAVDESVIQQLNPGAELDTVNVQLQRFPYPAFTTDILYITFKSILPLMMFICFCPAIVGMAEDVVKEKETMLRVIVQFFWIQLFFVSQNIQQRLILHNVVIDEFNFVS